jgi:hypothetical protein
MWYFAYGSDLSNESIMDWSKSIGQFVPPRGAPQPAVLLNHRLCFPAFEEFWQGGAADAVPEVGKSVGGALFKVTASTLRLLDQMAGRKQSKHGTEQGIRQRQLMEVKPYNSSTTIQANVYRLRESEPIHVPPTEVYLKRMADAAWQTGLSAMWIMHLRSFATQISRPDTIKQACLPATAAGGLRQPDLASMLKSQFPRLSRCRIKGQRELIVPINC